jgi:hypothetical protein
LGGNGGVMTNSKATFVEIPDPKGRLPMRRVELPIVRRMSLEALYQPGLVLLFFLIAFIVASAITYRDVTTDAWSTCQNRQEFLHGPVCHRRYLGMVGLSFFGAVLVGGVIWKAYRRISRVMMQSGPHVRVDCTGFWCEQLVGPIRFADVIEVRNIRSRTRRTWALRFVLNGPPHLAYGKQESEDAWGGKRSTFLFRTFGYLQTEELVEVIVFLANRRQPPALSRPDHAPDHATGGSGPFA